ncbi:hypothetical protein LWM68_20850 [Niabella sp. W65]|nr:hypothetical protein [Niabella sp. W65]MCH7364990.1 hypothetical protein [Niabella sp. W65]ULT46556.1 hypothetical protein KRR40_39750 [Niabella sp. I65]
MGSYAYYPNRDSLGYATLYGLETAHTFMRTTLRHPDFCTGWQYIIEAGLTGHEPTMGAVNLALLPTGSIIVYTSDTS